MMRNVIKIGIIGLLTAFLGIFIGKTLASYETAYLIDRKFCGEYRGVNVYKTGELNDDNALKYIYCLSEEPDILVECCDRLYIVGGDLPVSGGAHALGVTQDKTVFVTTDSYSDDVLPHELFHAYDNVHKASSTDEFKDIYEEEKYRIYVASGYDKKHRAEFFATAGAVYMISPVELAAKAPRTFGYINSFMQMYEVTVEGQNGTY